MGENESLSKGAKTRLGGGLGIIIGLILVLVGGPLLSNEIIFMFGLILGFAGMAVFGYGYFFVGTDYYTYDFGIFSTKIHKAFSEKFKEVSPDSELSLTNCKIKKFENSCDTGERKYEFINEWRGNRHIEKYEMIPTRCYFGITYIEFGSEEERLANENKIKEHFEQKPVSTNYFSSKNIQIVFQSYNHGFSTHLKKEVFFNFGVYADLKEIETMWLVRKASKSVVLK